MLTRGLHFRQLANVRYQIDDCNSEWTFRGSKFDLIFSRHLLGHVTDYERLYEKAI